MADSITKLPLAGQLGVALALAALIGGGFWYFYWTDAVAQRDSLTAQRDSLKEEIRKLEAAVANIENFRREVDEWRKKLDQVKQFLPAEKETPILLKQVEALAVQSNLGLKSITPRAATTAAEGFYQEWPIDMELDGTYHNLGRFLDKVRRIPRLVNVSNIRLKSLPKQSPSRTVSVGFTAKTFVYIEAAAPGAATKAGPAGRPAGR